MTIDEIIAALIDVENEITTISDAEDIDDEKVAKLSEKRLELVKTLASMQLSSDDEQKRQEFARAFADHAKTQLSSLESKRSKARSEIKKMVQGNAGLNVYGQIGK